MKKTFFNLLVIFSFGGISISGCSAAKEFNSASKTETPAISSDGTSEKPFILSASDLTRKFEADERAAGEKYHDKFLAVSGRIANIVEAAENLTVSLFGHHTMITVRCSFSASENSNLAKLQKGQATTLIGKIDGMKTGLYINLKECRVQQTK